MRNAENWKETKYVLLGGQLLSSRNPAEVSVGSRLIANLVATRYFEALALHASGRLLDLGCGKVPLYGTYRSRVNEVTCVDWGNSLHDTPHLDKEADLTKPIDFPDQSFDTIILSDVLEHIPTPLNLCREISRLLAPGGKLIMNVPFYYPLHEIPHDFYRYTEFALRYFMADSGMQILCLEPIGGAVEILFDITSKNILRLPLGGVPAARSVQAVAWWFTGTRLGEKLAKKTSSQFPLGYFMVAQRPN
ncbi:class I SAM-dependent methyltransferase [Bradyrhizobium sp. CCGUVB23]|uniref:class I SAM-dependent methyltransferase n=1 Tax=Bradyrhizobium sp. CCGUVB23 TaxID=2949630 RepID=UPI003531F22B